MSTSGHSIESDQLRELREQLAAQEKVIAANEQQIAAKEKKSYAYNNANWMSARSISNGSKNDCHYWSPNATSTAARNLIRFKDGYLMNRNWMPRLKTSRTSWKRPKENLAKRITPRLKTVLDANLCPITCDVYTLISM